MDQNQALTPPPGNWSNPNVIPYQAPPPYSYPVPNVIPYQAPPPYPYPVPLMQNPFPYAFAGTQPATQYLYNNPWIHHVSYGYSNVPQISTSLNNFNPGNDTFYDEDDPLANMQQEQKDALLRKLLLAQAKDQAYEFSKEKFEELLRNGENCFLDYKRSVPAMEDWENAENWSDDLSQWIRSAVTIYNAPHRKCRSGYIICGVQEVKDIGNTYNLVGCDATSKPEENLARVFSAAKFFENGSSCKVLLHQIYYELSVNIPHIEQRSPGPKLFYIFEIPPVPTNYRAQGKLLVPRLNIGRYLKKGKIYYRWGELGSTTLELLPDAEIEFWKAFTGLSTSGPSDSFVLRAELKGSSYGQLLYVITSSISEPNQKAIAELVRLQSISGFLDLDPNSQESGVLARAKKITNGMAIQIPDSEDWNPNKDSISWIFPCPKDVYSLSDFISKYEEHFRKKFVAKIASQKKTIKLLVIWDTSNELEQNILQQILRCFNSMCSSTGIQVSVACNLTRRITISPTLSSVLSQEIHQEQVELPDLVEVLFRELERNIKDNEFWFKLQDRPIERKVLPEKDKLHLRKYIHIINQSLIKDCQLNPEQFYRGIRKINWHEIDQNCYVKRSIQDALTHTIEKLMQNPTYVSAVHFLYQPGAGGTTLMKAILWGFTRSSNVVEIRMDAFDIVETSRAIKKLQPEDSEVPILIMVKDSIDKTKSSALIKELQRLKVKGVVLTVYRTQTFPDSLGAYEFILEDSFKDRQEAAAFYQFFEDKRLFENNRSNFTAQFGQSANECGQNFQKAKDSTSKLNLKQHRHKSALLSFSPFYMALFAFEKDFKGVASYVEGKLMLITQSHLDKLLKLIKYIAIGDYFINTETIIKKAAVFTMLIAGGEFDILTYLKSHGVTRECLDLLQETDSGIWKMRHSTLASQLIENIKQKRVVAKYIMEYVFNIYAPKSETIEREIIIPIFLSKSEDSKFPFIIEYVKDDVKDPAISIYEKLVEHYKNTTHVQGHYGRYLSLEKKTFKEARIQIQECLDCHKEPYAQSQLLTMMGGTYRVQLQEERDKPFPNRLNNFKNATDCFEKARSYFRQNPHAHLSYVDMIFEIHAECCQRLWKDAVAKLKAPQLEDAPIKALAVLEQYKEIFVQEDTDIKAMEKYIEKRQRLIEMSGNISATLGEYREKLQNDKDFIINAVMFVQLALLQSCNSFREMLSSTVKECHNVLKKAISKLPEEIQKNELHDTLMRLWLRVIRYSADKDDFSELNQLLDQWAASRSDFSPWPSFYRNLASWANSQITMKLEEPSSFINAEEWFLYPKKSNSAILKFCNKNDISRLQVQFKDKSKTVNIPAWNSDAEEAVTALPKNFGLKFKTGKHLVDVKGNQYKIINYTTRAQKNNAEIRFITKDETNSSSLPNHNASGIIGVGINGFVATYVFKTT